MSMKERTGYGPTEEPEARDQEADNAKERNEAYQRILERHDAREREDPVAHANEYFREAIQARATGDSERSDERRLQRLLRFGNKSAEDDGTDWTSSDRTVALKLFEVRNELTTERHAAVMQLEDTMSPLDWNGLAYDMLTLENHEPIDFLKEGASSDTAQALSAAVEKLIPAAEHRTIGPINYNSKDEDYPLTMDNLIDQLGHLEDFKRVITEGLENGNLSQAELMMLDQASDHLAECVNDLIRRLEEYQVDEEMFNRDDVEGEQRLTNYLAAVTHLEGLTTGQAEYDPAAQAGAKMSRDETINGRGMAASNQRYSQLTREFIAQRGRPDTTQAAS